MSEPGAQLEAYHRDGVNELRNLSRTARKVFDVTHLADLFRIHEDQQAALEGAGG